MLRPHKDTIVIGASLAQKPFNGGHTWALLQYLLGLKKLGWHVLLLDRLEPEMCVDARGEKCALEHSTNLAYFLDVMRCFELDADFALVYRGKEHIGISKTELLTRVKQSALFLNVMGFINDAEILDAAPRRAFLDIDPGFGQMWRALGLTDVFQNHDAYVTVAENIGSADCEIPTNGLEWIPTRPPVVLDYWPRAAHSEKKFTSIVSWRGAYAPMEYNNKRYGLRAHEFRKFFALPRLSGHAFELALDIHPHDATDIALLQTNGWSLVNPKTVARDAHSYQTYIQNSRAEFMVAKNMYVEARSGWFSDRSVCYLASGKPVLMQDTNVKPLYPTNAGLVTFSTLDEARAGADSIVRDYAFHARAARALAEAYFDSDMVLTRLLKNLEVL